MIARLVYFFFVMSFTMPTIASGGTAKGKITRIYVNNEWTMVLVPELLEASNELSNPDGCDSKSYYAIEPDDSNYNALHSTLLAAYLSGKEVNFWVSGCGGQNGKHPKIISVWVNN